MRRVKRLVCLVCSVFMLLIAFSAVIPTVQAATQLEKIISFAESKIGQAYLINYCQAFVYQCYKAGGIDNGSASSAKAAWNKYKVSTSSSNIPVGACVYFDTGEYGHVGLYVGNNKMIHASAVAGKVVKSDLSGYMSDYLGWGWQGNTMPAGASGSTAISVEVLPFYSSENNTIKDNDARLHGTVNKTASAAVQKLGIRITKNGTDYSAGKTYKATPDQGSYVGTPTVHPWFDIKDEVGYTLTHATTYKYQFYAQVEGKDYWSAEKTFTTTGSHSYGSWSTTSQATCTTAGSQKRTCACGTVETKAIAATGHSYSASYTVDKAANCTTAGSKSRHCTKCSAKTDVTTIPATGHSYTSWSTTSQANCTQAGSRKRSCSCGHVEYGTIAALGHSYASAWTVDKKATCDTAGTKSHHCARCSARSAVTTIPATGHAFGGWVVEKKASTTAEGREVRSCGNSGCGETETRTIPKLPSKGHTHSFGAWAEETKVSCTADGVMVSTCSSCGAKQTKTTAAAGHQFGEWTVEREASCDAEGELTSVCSVCGEEQTQKSEMLGHDFGQWAVEESGEEKERTCSRCGLTERSSAEEEQLELPEETTAKEEEAPKEKKPSEEPVITNKALIIIVAVSGVFALTGCGAAVFFVVKASKLKKP